MHARCTADEDCSDAHAELRVAILAGLQGIVPAVAVRLVPGDAMAAAAAERLGVDLKALQAEPCAARLVLLPYGEDKADLDEYRRCSYGSTALLLAAGLAQH